MEISILGVQRPRQAKRRPPVENSPRIYAVAPKTYAFPSKNYALSPKIYE